VSLAINCQPVFYVGAIQSTSLRYIVTAYLRISALFSLLRVCCLPSSSSTGGPWRSVLYHSSIVVSVLACIILLVPWPTNHSREHSHVLQARKSMQADVIYLWFQSKPIPPLDGHLFRRGIGDHSDGDVYYRLRCTVRFQTLEELGRHA